MADQNRFERALFRTRDPQAELEMRTQFGWELESHSATAVATGGNFAGGTYNVGNAGAFAGRIQFQTDTVTTLQMKRDRLASGYGDLVRGEQEFLALRHPAEPRNPLHLFWVCYLLVAPAAIWLMQFIRPLEKWVQTKTADWTENGLTIFSLALIPLLIALGRLLDLPLRRAYQRRMDAWSRENQRVDHRKKQLWNAAGALVENA